MAVLKGVRPAGPALHLLVAVLASGARGLGPARPCVGASASAAPAAPGPHRRPPPRRRRHYLPPEALVTE